MRAPIADRVRTIITTTGRAVPATTVPVAPPFEIAPPSRATASTRQSLVTEHKWSPSDTYAGDRIESIASQIARAQADAVLLTRSATAPSPFVFFDLETTGLAGGAGTRAFLVGFGWFDAAGGFVVRQYLLTSIDVERTMLEAVRADLRSAGTLVSFNGKSFDAPLLETRYLYNRLTWDGHERPHLDVLHAARRFWAEPIVRVAEREAPGGGIRQFVRGPIRPACTLSRLERQVLGSERRDDVPGADIPSRYFAYIRSGDIGPLDAVLEHNRRDLLSLAALTARLLRLLSEGASGAADPREALGLGRVYERAGLVRRASDAFNRALDLAEGSDAATQLAALRGLAGLNRRARRHDVAAIRWREILSIPGCPPDLRREAAEALAVHHEHRARDLVRARELALSALAVAAEAKRAALLYRVARIDRKLTRDPMAFSFD
jgi:uncharacterized protein YprB with RNaseH-like and TPR domain